MISLIAGDALEQLRLLPADSVHCCVTSPPYFGLRSYLPDGHEDKHREIGLESSPDEYIDALVAVFREVRRVLRKDGTLWLNIGDSYAGSWGNQGRKTDRGTQRPINGPMLQRFNGYPDRQQFRAGNPDKNQGNSNRDGLGPVSGCKPKDMIGIPWMLAFALRADGWWLRQDIIWSKPNPMPESVTDRCTKAHEYLFMLSKSERYFYDSAAIAEPGVMLPQARLTPRDFVNGKDAGRAAHRRPGYRLREEAEQENATRNKRSVWTVATAPFAEAHFACYPPGLIEPCILAGCPAGGTVLDPFGGAGTTGLVADRLGRDSILIELNPIYCEMIRKRIIDDAPLFTEFSTQPPKEEPKQLNIVL